MAGRKGSKVFGAVWEAQKAAPWPIRLDFLAYFIVPTLKWQKVKIYENTSGTNLKRHHSRPDECVKMWQVTIFGRQCSIFCGMRANFERFIQAFEEIVVILSSLILKGVPDLGCRKYFDWKGCH